MFRRREEIRERLLKIIETFRRKGALSPDKAMTAEELGLPQKFEEAMERRLGRLGIFVKVDGKYYMSEERLKEVKEQFVSKGGFGPVVINEKEIVKEIVKVRCRYCGALNLEIDNKRSNCGATLYLDTHALTFNVH